MSQVSFGRLRIISREKPLLLEESVKNLTAFADLQDNSFDDAYTGASLNWVLGSGVTLTATGSAPGSVAIYDVSAYGDGSVYG